MARKRKGKSYQKAILAASKRRPAVPVVSTRGAKYASKDVVVIAKEKQYQPARVVVGLRQNPSTSAASRLIKAAAPSRKLPPGMARVGRIRTYEFPDDILSQYIASPALYSMVRDGRYVYANGRLCLFSPVCVSLSEEGKAFVHKNAWNHPDRYCLAVETMYSVKGTAGGRYYRAPRNHFIHASGIKLRQFETADFLDFINSGDGGIGKTFPECLDYYMKTAGMDMGTLADEVGVDDTTIRGYLKGQHMPETNILVALCIAMNLFPIYSYRLLRSAGKVLMETELDRAYQVLLNTAYEYSVHDCNEFLKEKGLPPLTNI